MKIIVDISTFGERDEVIEREREGVQRRGAA